MNEPIPADAPAAAPATPAAPAEGGAAPAVEAPTNQAFLDTLPEANRGEEMFKQFNDMEGFVKSFKDTKTALSSSPAAIELPASAGDYNLSALPENHTPTEADTKFRSDIQNLFHASKVTQIQATSLEQGWNQMVEVFTEQEAAARGQSDAEFNTLTTELFGDKGDAVLASGKALLDKHVDAKLKPFVGELDNKAMMVLASVLDGIKSEFIGEDKIPDGTTTPPSGALTNDDIKAKVTEIMLSQAFQNPSDQGHEAAVAAKTALIAQLKAE